MMTMHWTLDTEGRLVVTWEKSENIGQRFGDHADRPAAINRLSSNRVAHVTRLFSQRGKQAA